MRTVNFKKWIPEVKEETENGILGKSWKIKEGTGCWEKDFVNLGMFHQWAYNYEEFNDYVGNYTVALVELSDGTIEEVFPKNIKFLE